MKREEAHQEAEDLSVIQEQEPVWKVAEEVHEDGTLLVIEGAIVVAVGRMADTVAPWNVSDIIIIPPASLPLQALQQNPKEDSNAEKDIFHRVIVGVKIFLPEDEAIGTIGHLIETHTTTTTDRIRVEVTVVVEAVVVGEEKADELFKAAAVRILQNRVSDLQPARLKCNGYRRSRPQKSQKKSNQQRNEELSLGILDAVCLFFFYGLA